MPGQGILAACVAEWSIPLDGLVGGEILAGANPAAGPIGAILNQGE